MYINSLIITNHNIVGLGIVVSLLDTTHENNQDDGFPFSYFSLQSEPFKKLVCKCTVHKVDFNLIAQLDLLSLKKHFET